MVVLTMNIDQRLRKLLHLLCRHGLSVDPANAFARLHFAADNHSIVILWFQIHGLQLFPYSGTAGEYKLHQRAVCSLAQHFLLKFSSQSQIDTSDQQGFPRTGFSCEDIQSLAELHLGLLHQGQVFYM